VVQGSVPSVIRTSMDAWAGCLGGALEEREYRAYLADGGFNDVDVEVARVYGAEQACCDDSCGPQQTELLASRASRKQAPDGRLRANFRLRSAASEIGGTSKSS
jgi:hypothetical protein